MHVGWGWRILTSFVYSQARGLASFLENADNEDCNVDNRKGSEYLGAREDEETES